MIIHTHVFLISTRLPREPEPEPDTCHTNPSAMYSCANYPRGCRGRVNRQGAKCSDCVVSVPLGLAVANPLLAIFRQSCWCLSHGNPNFSPVTQPPPASFCIAIRATTRLQAHAPLRTPERVLLQGVDSGTVRCPRIHGEQAVTIHNAESLMEPASIGMK